MPPELPDVPFDDASWELVIQIEARLNWIYTRLEYTDYLRTAHWYRLRELALEHYGHSCSRCGNKRHLQVHHRLSWDRGRGQERLCDLTVLCNACHARYHDIPQAA